MTRETDEARAARDAAADDWRNHRKVCSTCALAARRRAPKRMCITGRGLNATYAQAEADLTVNRAADKTPQPGQGELWPRKEDPAAGRVIRMPRRRPPPRSRGQEMPRKGSASG
jgi:hypothetical protein